MNKVILMLFFLISAIAACVEEPKYNREQCIVRVNIEWENMSDAHKENIIVIITNAIRSAPDMDFNRIPPGFSVQGTDREFIYYQHEFDCENRLANMEKLLSYVRSNTGHFSLPKITVDPGNFKPGVETIRMSGPNWKDQEQPIGERITIDGKDYFQITK